MAPIQAVFEFVDRRDPSREIAISNFMGLESNMHTVIANVINMIRDGNDDPASLVFFEWILQGVGVRILDLSDELILIYKVGDPDVEEILEAALRELPELLTSEVLQVRLLAKYRLDTLAEHMVNEHNRVEHETEV